MHAVSLNMSDHILFQKQCLKNQFVLYFGSCNALYLHDKSPGFSRLPVCNVAHSSVVSSSSWFVVFRSSISSYTRVCVESVDRRPLCEEMLASNISAIP